MSLSRTFIDRPVLAAVLSIGIFVAGLMALPFLPVSEYPDVVPPAVVVTATYPGANPKVIAETVAAPIEEQINGVENMLYLSSQATTDGVLNVTVTFKIGTDPDLAETQVQNRVQRALPRLPAEVRQIGVITQKQSPNLTMVVHLLSSDSRYDELYLRNYAVLNVRDKLRRIQGMAGASGAPNATGTALQSAGPSSSYAGRIKARIRPNIIYSDSGLGNPVAEAELKVAPDGSIISSRLLKSSGDPEWDKAVLRAIEKTETLPRDVDGRVPPHLIIRFQPRE
jgi:TonB family protein